MKRDDVLRVLRQHRAELQGFGVQSLSLFGSTARDEAGPESDVDILVEFEGPATFDQYIDLQIFLEGLLRCKVDLLTQRAVREYVRPYIEKDSIRVA